MRGIRIGEPPVGHVEEPRRHSRPGRCAARHAGARRSRGPRQPGPGRDVLDAGRSERGQVAAHRLVRLGRATDPAPQPRLRGRQRRPPAAAPQATRRHLDERDQVRDGVGEGIGVGIGPALRQERLELRAGARLLPSRLGRGDDLVHVDVRKTPPERAPTPEHALADALQRGRSARQSRSVTRWIVPRRSVIRTARRASINPSSSSGRKPSMRDQNAT